MHVRKKFGDGPDPMGRYVILIVLHWLLWPKIYKLKKIKLKCLNPVLTTKIRGQKPFMFEMSELYTYGKVPFHRPTDSLFY